MIGRQIHIDVLKFLVEHNQQSFSIRELATNIKKDYKNTFGAVKELPSISIKKVSGSNQVSFNLTFSDLLFLVETERKNSILHDRNLEVMYKDLSKVNTQFILLLFGSRANKTHRKKSDYDFLLISDNPQDIEKKLSIYPLDVHLNTFSLDEFREMLLSKEFTVVSEAVRNNIIFFGIEDYYRLLQNAR